MWTRLAEVEKCKGCGSQAALNKDGLCKTCEGRETTDDVKRIMQSSWTKTAAPGQKELCGICHKKPVTLACYDCSTRVCSQKCLDKHYDLDYKKGKNGQHSSSRMRD